MIKAPYNFVPLNKKVFYPPWSENVSHDIPFSDGESGEISIAIEAKSPIFIRNHYQEGDDYYTIKKEGKTIRVSKEFCHIKNNDGSKQYYIPSTSIKGMIRNVLEIMSFSKIKVDEKKLKQSLSVRDMTPAKYCLDNSITKLKDCPQNQKEDLFNHPMVATATKCGFLIQENDKYYIETCGQVLTIRDYEIQKKFHNYSKDIETAQEKYNLIGHKKIPFSLEVIDQNGRETTIAVYNKISNDIGTLVLTGSIDNKKKEFIFKNPTTKKEINKIVFENFKKVYFNNQNVIDGQYWKTRWNNGEKIPIFYIEENRQIQAIGLTQIFKLAYNHTLFDAIKQDINDNKLDLAQTIFGMVKDKNALKGRLQFSHFKSSHITFEAKKTEILGSPQPTYYPNYIRQTNINGDKVNKFITLMDDSATISGYKRYPLHNSIKASYIADDEKTDIQTHFNPLDKNSKFHGKLRFHNLKKVEIGAIISALTFHGNESTHYHNLGMAKSLGYGKINISLNLNNLKYTKEEYLKEYELEMSLFQDNWLYSQSIIELFSMANKSIVNDKNLIYQKLENPQIKGNDNNDFVNSKKDKEYLQNYSHIVNIDNSNIISYVDDLTLEEKQKEKEEETSWNRIKDTKNIAVLENFKTRYPTSIKLSEIDMKINQIQQDELLEKEQKAQQEANEKWEAIQNIEERLKQKALEDFIQRYPISSYISQAQELLATFTIKTKAKSSKDITELDNVTNASEFKKVLESLEEISSEDKEIIKQNAIRVYSSVKGKKKKDFFRDIQLARFINNEFEQEVKNNIK